MLDVTRVREGLAELGRLDPGYRLFGASTHRYALAPPVEPQLVEAVETALGAPLPEGYGRFLTELGDGGAGPYYGVLPLEGSVLRAAAMTGRRVPKGTPASELVEGLPAFVRDFPLEADVDFAEVVGAPTDWDEQVALLEADPDYEARWDELRDEHRASPFDGGWIPISDYGCGDLLFLVLRGPRRGTVWANGLDSATGLYSLEVGFEELYERWLGDALDRARSKDFAPVNARYGFLRYGDNPRYRPV